MKLLHVVNLIAIISVLFIMASPVYAYQWQGIEITPRVGLVETYDTNITSVRSDTMSDLKSDASVGVDLVREGHSSRMSVSTAMARQMFADHSSFDNTAIDLSGKYSVDLSRNDQLSIENAFSRSDSPTAFVNEFGGTNGLYTRNINTFSTEYKHDLSTQLSLRVNYRNILSYYPANIQSDSMGNIVGTGLDYSFGAKDIVSLDYKFQAQDINPGPSATVNEVASNYRHYFTPTLYSDVGTGVDQINDFEGDNKVYPLFRAALTRDTDENTRLSVSVDQKHDILSDTADVFSNWRLAGNIVKQLSPRLQGMATVFYGEGKYVTSGSTVSFAGIDVGINYELRKNADLQAGYQFSTKNTLNGTGDYDKNMIYSGITYKF